MEIHATLGGVEGLHVLNLHHVTFELVEGPLRARHVTNSTKVDIVLGVNLGPLGSSSSQHRRTPEIVL